MKYRGLSAREPMVLYIKPRIKILVKSVSNINLIID